jgi:ADP-ribose pyrophosphatase YjhB (NUDIX family)
MNSKHIISVSAVILNQDKNILLIKGPKRGWELPGGHLESNEKIIDALIREVHEETGVEIYNVYYRGLFHNVEENTINLLFIAEYDSGELTTSEESLEVKFVSLEEASRLVTWGNFLKRIESVLYGNSPFIVEF